MFEKNRLKKDWRNNFGRRKGKALRRSQKVYLEDLERYCPIGVRLSENPDRKKVKFFNNENPLWLEIGFGSGEHIFFQAQDNPSINLIGCEPYINGVATLLGKIRGKNLKNIMVYPGDVRDLFDVVNKQALDRVYLLYPDPWPKRRHHKRRFVSKEYLDLLIPLIKPGGEFHIATDIGDYVRQTLLMLRNYDNVLWMAESPENWRVPWQNWVQTRYERKAIAAGRRSYYLTFKKI